MRLFSLRRPPSGDPIEVEVPENTDEIQNTSNVNGGVGTLTAALNALLAGIDAVVVLLAGIQSGAHRAIVVWGDQSITATTTTRYLSPYYSSQTASVAPVQFSVPSAGVLRNLRVRHNTPAGNGNPIVYTLRVNGAPTALTCTLASTDPSGSDLANAVAVAAGDLVGIEVTKALGIGSSPTDVLASLELAAP